MGNSFVRMFQLPHTVAVVDDEPEMRKALRRLLLTHGFQVQVYAGGEELMASLAAGLPDCVVMDLHMPGTNGFDLLLTFSSLHIATPVVVITGRDEPDTEERVRSLGAVAYLKKPVDEMSLVSAVEKALSRSLMQQSSLSVPRGR
jgi:FixJ family two-component response regulator